MWGCARIWDEKLLLVRICHSGRELAPPWKPMSLSVGAPPVDFGGLSVADEGRATKERHDTLRRRRRRWRKSRRLPLSMGFAVKEREGRGGCQDEGKPVK